MPEVTLVPASADDMRALWLMQRAAFAELLRKYRDYETSPAAESFEKVMERFKRPSTTYYFIEAGGERVGAIRVIDRRNGSRKRISPLFIMPEHRRRGYAQAAIAAAERIHGADNWALNTILREEGNIRLYEKMGYRRTGVTERINERMELVYFEK